MSTYALTLTWDDERFRNIIAEAATSHLARAQLGAPHAIMQSLTRVTSVQVTDSNPTPAPIPESDLVVQTDFHPSITPHLCTGEVSSAARIRHIPTGTEVSSSQHSSQLENKAAALNGIYAALGLTPPGQPQSPDAADALAARLRNQFMQGTDRAWMSWEALPAPEKDKWRRMVLTVVSALPQQLFR